MSCNCGECPPSKARRVVRALVIAGVAAVVIWCALLQWSTTPDKVPVPHAPEKPIRSHP